MSSPAKDRRLYFSFPLFENFREGVLLDKTRYTDNTVISYYYKKRSRPLPQNCIRDYHKTVYDHYHKTVYDGFLEKPYKIRQKRRFLKDNMYTYMYCMYRIGGIIAAAYSYERRLYTQYVERPATSLFCGLMDRPEYLGGVA